MVNIFNIILCYFYPSLEETPGTSEYEEYNKIRKPDWPWKLVLLTILMIIIYFIHKYPPEIIIK
jgi:hypothetical protein